MAPSWFIVHLGVELNVESIVTGDLVRAGLTVVEVSEGSVVVRVSRIVSPSWLVFDLGVELDIKTVIAGNLVWAGLSIVEVGERSVVI